MPIEIIAIAGLVLIFLLSTLLKVHMGALAFVAAAVVGIGLAGMSVDDVLGGFPIDLFVILAGVTYLFAIAKNNGAIDWVVDNAVRATGGRVWAMPWLMFLIAALLAGVGAVPPAVVAILAPTALRLAHKHGVNPFYMGLMVANGVCAGEFSPIGLFGLIVNQIAEANGVATNPMALFAATFVFSALLCIVLALVIAWRDGRSVTDFGGIGLARPRGDSAPGATGTNGTAARATATLPRLEGEVRTRMTVQIALTLAGLVAMVLAVTVFRADIGIASMTVAVLLSFICRKEGAQAIGQIAWGTIFLVVGIVTYVGVLQKTGAVDYVSDAVGQLGSPLLVALLICVIGAVVSAFASTTGILGALVPLAVPFMLAGAVNPVAMLIALSISSSVVDSTPFSTTGALIVANTEEDKRDAVFSRLLRWGILMMVVAPLFSWLLFIVPGW